MQQANVIIFTRLVWVCPTCQYENILDADDIGDINPTEAVCGHCGADTQLHYAREAALNDQAKGE